MRFKMIACVLAVALLSAIGSRADERARFLRRQELDAACEHASVPSHITIDNIG
jgi:hypothetical protein